MSLLQKQSKSFAASMAAASSKFAKKTAPVAIPVSSSPAQRGTPEPRMPVVNPKQPFSQPADTGKGEGLQTQVVYAIDYLKTKMDQPPLAFEAILSYLSQDNAERSWKNALSTILRRHPQVTFDSKAHNGKGGYKFRPKHSIFTADELLKTLQDYETFKGIDVKELKEGWPSVDKTIDRLEDEHRIIVIRHKKDGTPRFVYWDNADWHIKIDEEFRNHYLQIKLPTERAALVQDLVREGQLPAGKKKEPETKKAMKVEKPKRKQRRGGKLTNKHMQGIFKDYSGQRR